MTNEGGHWEEIKVAGDQLVKTIRDLVHEGNVRRIIIKDEDDHTFLEIPLTVGVVGAVLLPVWAALGALAAIVKGFTIVIERTDTPSEERREEEEHSAHVT